MNHFPGIFLHREKIFGGREDYEEKNMYTATRVTFPRTQLATLGCGGGRSPEAVNWLAKPRGGRLKVIYGWAGGWGWEIELWGGWVGKRGEKIKKMYHLKVVQFEVLVGCFAIRPWV